MMDLNLCRSSFSLLRSRWLIYFPELMLMGSLPEGKVPGAWSW